MGVPVRCVLFTAPPKLCEHNDTVRALNDGKMNPEKRSILPHSAFSSFAARYREPKATEGFQDIVRIDFQVSDSTHLAKYAESAYRGLDLWMTNYYFRNSSTEKRSSARSGAGIGYR